ncbi:hypothetical protein ENBRE01_2341 [Enteropsectra breve]|nr:hypothetical protein ENBRE01_2341 [Enteropsectra breve]
MMPLLITKGKRDSVLISNGIMILETEKAWCTQEAIYRWIERALPRVLMTNKRGLLVWDSDSTHRATAMKRYTALRRIGQVMIPYGTTAYLQSLDIAINKPFKDYLREETNEFIEFRQERNARGNLIKPKIDEVSNWVRKAWSKITPEIVANALISGYLFPNQSFEEAAINKHERIGPLLRNVSETQTQESLLVTADYIESDELAIFQKNNNKIFKKTHIISPPGLLLVFFGWLKIQARALIMRNTVVQSSVKSTFDRDTTRLPLAKKPNVYQHS